MARGRLISNEITRDKKVNDLSDDTCRLAFTWLISFADKEGRTHGDPALVRSQLFPRRSDVTIEQMETYIKELHDAGLIIWYQAEGDWWITFPKFSDHQPGLRKDRESVSMIPPPPGVCDPPDKTDVAGDNPADIRQDDGNTPPKCGLSEVKLKDKNPAAGTAISDDKANKSDKDNIRCELEKHFLITTGIPAPRTNTDKQKRQAGELWYAPLREIAELTDWNIDASRALINKACIRLKDVTISSPKSLIKTIHAIIGEESKAAQGKKYSEVY